MKYSSILESPIGQILLESEAESICRIGFAIDGFESPSDITEQAKKQLQEYFYGKRQRFTFKIQQEGTKFQQEVWNTLTQIECGKPISYARLSFHTAQPLAIRAIAAANGKNKIMIAVPCHRVIGSTGNLVGYAGELWRKKWLIEHEAKMMNFGQSVFQFRASS